MKTLTETGIAKIQNLFLTSLSHATYEKDGSTYTIDFLKAAVENGLIRVSIYFNEEYVGQVSNVKLVDVDGDIVAHSTRTFIKPSSKGLYVAFTYRLLEEDEEDV